jgi:hypothetical protein
MNKRLLKEYVPSDPASLTKALKDIQSLGYPNPLNPREIVIGNSVIVEISIFDKRLYFSSIHSIDRGQGNAGMVMQKIVDIADKYGVTIALTPKPFGTGKDMLNKAQLVTFYKKYGFKPEKDGFGDMERVANKLSEVKESKGLWYNMRAKRARGEKPARRGSKAYKKAVSAAKRINAMEEVDMCNTCAIALLEDIKAGKQPLTEAEYQGRTVQLGKVKRTTAGPKKFSVYVKNDKGNVVKVNFGDPGLSIKRDNPQRRKAYRARHNCDNPGPKWKSNYWSCRNWSSKPVSQITK